MTNSETIYQAVSAAFTPDQLAAIVAAAYTAEQLADRKARITVTAQDKDSNPVDPAAALNAVLAADLFHTYSEWRQMGRQVKRYEKASISVPLWRWTDKPSKAQREATGDDAPESDPHYYKQLSHLFALSQTERIQPVHVKTPEEIAAINAQLRAQRAARKVAQQPA